MKQLAPNAVWLFFLQQSSALIGLTVLVLIFFTYFGVTLSTQRGTSLDFATVLVIMLLLLFAGFILAYIGARLTYHFYRYELTPNGFRKESGVIYKRYVTIPYEKIQNVDIHRPLIARLLGLSDIQIQTAGMSYSVGRYGPIAEGRLPGLSVADAETMRDELIQRSKTPHQIP